MAQEYKELDTLLKQKVNQLAELVKPVDMLSRPTSEVQSKQKQLREAIRQADLLWRKNLAIECDTLIEASFGLGNGWDIDSFECRLTRTRERIKFLSTSTAYSWIRGR